MAVDCFMLIEGGSVVARPPEGSTFVASANVIAGNTCLYGATGGEVLFCMRGCTESSLAVFMPLSFIQH
eukprot:6082463-Amphidinium_carterae.3